MPALKYAVGALRNCTPKPLADRPAETTIVMESIAGTQLRATFDRRELLIGCDAEYSRLIGLPTLKRLVAWLAWHEEWRVLPALLLVLVLSACESLPRLWPDVG